MTLPTDAKDRKAFPIATGCLDYFPDALTEVAGVSFVGNEQHHPGSPLHWDRAKSTDEADALMRHFVERGTRDADGARHSAKVAWRALALLQKEIEADANLKSPTFLDPALRKTAEDCYRAGDLGKFSPHVAAKGRDVCVACGITREQASLLAHEFISS